MYKVKITYSEYGIVKAKIINTAGFFNIGNDLSMNSITDSEVIKIERILEADENNIEDLTQ